MNDSPKGGLTTAGVPPKKVWSRIAPSIYRHEPTGALYERSKIDGKQTFRKLASFRVSDAKDELIELRSRRARVERGLEKAPDDKNDWTIAKVLNAYLDANCPDRELANRPPLTASEEKRRAKVLLKFFKTQRVRDLDKQMCASYGAWRIKHGDEGRQRRRSADMELVTLSNALDFSGISTEAMRGRKSFYRASTARHARDCAPQSGDELHQIARAFFKGNVRSHVLGWQALFEAFTGCRTNEVLRFRMDAKKRGDAGFVEDGKWFWLHRSKSGVNPWVAIAERPEMLKLIEEHRKWHKDMFPASPWYFPSPEHPERALSVTALNARLGDLQKTGLIERKITSHGLRAFYVLVRRSDGVADGQIAAEIGDKTIALIANTYGSLPPKWQGGPEIGFIPSVGGPAWEQIKPASKVLKHQRGKRIIRSVIHSRLLEGGILKEQNIPDK